MIRTFVAVELDTSLRQALAQTQAALREQLRKTVPNIRIQWVRPESIHLTLKFLGYISEARVGEIQTALIRVAGGHSRFTVGVEGLGVFPDVRAPRVLWIGLTTCTDVLKRLAAEVEIELGVIGFAPEPKPFNPHLTLARMKERPHDIGRALSNSGLLRQEVKLGPLTVSALSLMKSYLQPSGSAYTQLFQVPLKEA